ncbi:MAG: hypothetical protein LH618_03300 [Saprospiraceae bacterium]|nr:hypothetical protein [Saprospiraceae bacterium]
MKKLLLAITALLLLAVGCYHYDTQFEGPYEDGDQPAAFHSAYEILTVEDGQIHLYHRLFRYNKILANLPPGIEKAAINHAHDRIAYQVPGDNIVIADTAGLTLAKVNSSAGAQWFDWHPNDRSLCVLTNFQLSIWGDPLTPAATNLSSLFPLGSSEWEMHCATVTADGSVVVAYRDYAGFSIGYESKIAVIPTVGSIWKVEVNSYERVQWLRADRSGLHVLYGVSSGFTDPRIWRLDIDDRATVERTKASFGALSPQANQLVTWADGRLEVYNQITDERFYFYTGNIVLTALDW